MFIPEALKGFNFVTPPKEFINFAKKYGVDNTLFIDDEQSERSLRFDKDIFVRITGKWDVYTLFPIDAKTYDEVIVLRFLHEVGHVNYNHSGSLNNTTTLHIPRTNDFWRNAFSGDEGQAWFFAFNIRKYKRNEYDQLIFSFKSFTRTHKYKCPVFWANTADEEWQRMSKNPFPTDITYCPQWLIDEYEKL